MIINSVIQLLWDFASPIIAKIPSVQINYDGISNSTIFQYLRAGLYFFPMTTVTQILTIVIALWVLRIVIAFLHSLWNSLPII